jgi:hypothetical protein
MEQLTSKAQKVCKKWYEKGWDKLFEPIFSVVDPLAELLLGRVMGGLLTILLRLILGFGYVFCIIFFILFPLVSFVGLMVIRIPLLFMIGLCVCISVSAVCLIWGFIEKNVRSSAWRVSRNVFQGLPILWGGAFVFWGAWFSSGFLNLTPAASNVEFPLSYLFAVTVDSKQQVYCAIRMYERIQVYDKDGHFLKSWASPIPWTGHAKATRLIVDENDNIHMIRSGVVRYIYDPNGQLISRETLSLEDYKEISQQVDRLSVEQDGILYRGSSGLFPKITMTTPNGEDSVVVSEPLLLWLLKAPFPAFVLFILSGICSNFLNDLTKKYEKSNEVCKLSENTPDNPRMTKTISDRDGDR